MPTIISPAIAYRIPQPYPDIYPQWVNPENLLNGPHAEVAACEPREVHAGSGTSAIVDVFFENVGLPEGAAVTDAYILAPYGIDPPWVGVDAPEGYPSIHVSGYAGPPFLSSWQGPGSWDGPTSAFAPKENHYAQSALPTPEQCRNASTSLMARIFAENDALVADAVATFGPPLLYTVYTLPAAGYTVCPVCNTYDVTPLYGPNGEEIPGRFCGGNICIHST